NRFWPTAAAALMGGFAYTGFSEWLNTVLRTSWSYSEWMPVLHLFGFRLGISPMLQIPDHAPPDDPRCVRPSSKRARTSGRPTGQPN
ncbi:MAG: hypothetical protein Q8M82_12400, partial [Bosea sp. (in: a-proteobacteria)]|nr:hypothetical protein [Bosea sp. (in: a-proteobacteria)]